jgi:hypothetical protein
VEGRRQKMIFESSLLFPSIGRGKRSAFYFCCSGGRVKSRGGGGDGSYLHILMGRSRERGKEDGEE